MSFIVGRTTHRMRRVENFCVASESIRKCLRSHCWPVVVCVILSRSAVFWRWWIFNIARNKRQIANNEFQFISSIRLVTFYGWGRMEKRIPDDNEVDDDDNNITSNARGILSAEDNNNKNSAECMKIMWPTMAGHLECALERNDNHRFVGCRQEPRRQEWHKNDLIDFFACCAESQLRGPPASSHSIDSTKSGLDVIKLIEHLSQVSVTVTAPETSRRMVAILAAFIVPHLLPPMILL